MIDKKEINLNWINLVSKANRNADKILVEKVIRALLLLEGLAMQNLNFVFKYYYKEEVFKIISYNQN